MAMDWVKPPEGVWVRVVRDEGPVAERWHEIEPGWTRTWMSFPAADLGEAVGLLRVQVVDQGEVLGERGMWRR